VTLPDNKRRDLALLIAGHVQLEVLADIVAEDGILVARQFDELIGLALNSREGKSFTVAQAVVEAYDAANALELLMSKVRRRKRGDDFFATELVDFVYDDESADNLEAAIAKRARTLRSAELRQFLDEHEPKVCVIAGVAALGPGKPVKFLRGTGFLAGEDLVITARHVLRYHIQNGGAKNPSPGPLYAFFDHLEGSPILDPRDPKILARRVAFHPTDWLQEFSDLVIGDGKTPEPLTSDQIDEFAHNLDMVLIKLAEPIGAYTRWRGGGPRRGWVTLPDEKIPAGLELDDRILIPQHPHGETQQIDFGRYKAVDSSATRIRYDTETDRGTSGAPCFNQQFQLVGMHNAAFRPRGCKADEALNQAIRFDHILRHIRARIPAPPAAKPARLWSVAEDDAKPEVIIGRGKFLEWLERAVAANTLSRQERVYAAQAARAHCGKSFTLKILKAALRGKSDPVIVMGTERQALPSTALDFLAVLLDQLSIPVDALKTLPPRPDRDLPPGSPDGDKPNLWIPRDIPEWLNKQLRARRATQVDLREEAKAEVERYRSAGLPPDPEDLRLASLESPQLLERHRWERLWIVLDDVSDDALKGEVRELLAALVGSQSDEGGVNEELRSIRWLFLGSRPAFLPEACVEQLDQMAVPQEDIAACIHSFALSINKHPPQEFLDHGVAFVEIQSLTPKKNPLYEDPKTRLTVLQTIIAELRNYFMKRLGGRPA
jgi:hypothetical protein